MSTADDSKLGYKGHRKGTKKEKAHKIFDDGFEKQERKDILQKIVRLGVTEGTAAAWYQSFKGGAVPKGRKPAKAKKAPAPAKKKVPAKKKAPGKAKKPALATPAAAPAAPASAPAPAAA